MTAPSHPQYWDEAKRYLCTVDATLAEIIGACGKERLASRGSAFFSLARAIVGQQISVRAAESIWLRVEALLGGCVDARTLLALDEETLRGAGLSRSKTLYLRELSTFFVARPALLWHEKEDEQIVADLLAIKGIGRWSAEMFLIFHLLRPDVFPIGDIGLRRGIERAFYRGESTSASEMTALAERWRPYRTVATWYLWRSLDPIAVAY